MSNDFIATTISDVKTEAFNEIISTVNEEPCQVKDGCFATDLSIKYNKTSDYEEQHIQPQNTSVTVSKIVKNKNLKSGNKKSFVWKYFAHPKNVDGVEDRSRTECIECKSQLAFNASGTTTTMLNHLKSRHPKISETEEWKKMKSISLNVGNCENSFSTSRNNESPTETLSPSASFELPKLNNSSPECKVSEGNGLSIYSNNYDSKCSNQGRLLCLTKLLPPKLMMNSCITTTNAETNSMVTTLNNNAYNNTNGGINTNSYYPVNRSTVKRKRKKSICMQNTKQLVSNGTNDNLYSVKSNKLEKIENPEMSDLASIQSMSAISHNSANINKIIFNNFLSGDQCNIIYNDNNNNFNSTPFETLKLFSSFNVSGSSGSCLSSKTGITESDRIIVYWLIKDLRPYSILEEIGIKTLFSSLMPSVVIPSVSSIKNEILPSIYWNIKSQILNDFSVECGAALSIDLWDIPTTGCIFASVKLHYYTHQDSKQRCKMLITKEINTKYLCSDLLLDCCNEIGVDFPKLQFLPVVMNNAESMTDELENVGEIEQNKKFIIIPCLMSSLQEVANIGLQEPEIGELLDKCRVLKELAGAYNLQLDNDNTIENNYFSTSKCSCEKFELIYWVYLNLEQIIDKLDCCNSNRFNKDDELFLKQLTPLLEHIYQTLKVVEQNKLFFSASMIKSIILTMNKSPFQPKDDDHPGVIKFKMSVKDHLNKIYPLTGRLHKILCTATVLDPRFKKYRDSDESILLQELRNQVINSNELLSSPEFFQDSLNLIKRENLHSIFGDCFSQEPKSEVDQYLNEPKIDIEKDPVKWWQDNSSRFPHLSKLAMKYLCIPLANQSCLESSDTNSFLYSRRKDIELEEMDHYLFLNYNWR